MISPCTTCGGELVEVPNSGRCADDDPECDCDTAYECIICKQWHILNCPAHKGTSWSGLPEAQKEEDEK